MVSRLAIMMGGRVAEEITFGKENITSGASSDIEQATKLARAMVTQWGFSDQLGQVAYGENQQEVFLGHSVAQTKNVSESTAQKIDNEIRRLIDEAYSEAKRIITEKHHEFVALAEGLLEYETLTGDEIKALIRGEKPPATSATTARRIAARPCRRPARRRAARRKAGWSRSRSRPDKILMIDRPGRSSGRFCFMQWPVTRCNENRLEFQVLSARSVAKGAQWI